ncbi:phosphatase PAP2 family protein [Kitasatospora sp. NPDC127067]|uniref:phosphatase PAP2 family protein n=1 Tax=Kitasatospora sp. NPDC127067 TaxID=3347126 RepID=UPI0036570D4F
MTTEAEAAPAAPTSRTIWARRITDGLEPKNVIVALLPVLGGLRYGLPGIGWALFAILFAAVVPTLIIRHGMRKGTVADRHVGHRQRRLTVFPLIMGSVLLSFAVMIGLDAPADLTALVLAMFASLVPILVITAWWKVSVHTAVATGAVVCLAIALGPLWLLLAPLVPAIGWSRVVLRDHTAAQTVVGAVVGALTAGLTFWLAR